MHKPLIPALVLLATGTAGAADVAIVAAAANTADPQNNTRFTDARDVLLADGRFDSVDIINTTRFAGGGTPSLDTLQGYDAVLTWSNDSHDDSVSLGNVLADYVDGGGGVVVAVFGNTSPNPARQLLGRWDTGGYEIIPQGGGHVEGPASPPSPGQQGGFVVMADPLVPDHPLFDGIDDPQDVRLNWATTSNGLRFGAHRPVVTSLTPGSTKLAVWEDGRTAVAIDDDNPSRIDLGFHPVSDRVNAGYYDLDGEADVLLANAVFYSATVPEPAAGLAFAAAGLLLSRRRR